METQRGFTLIEMMVTIVVLAIVLALVVPNFSRLIQDSNLSASVNNISAALNLARSEAVKRDATVCICPSSNRTTCVTNWTVGMIVYAQSPNVGTCTTVGASLATTAAPTQSQVKIIAKSIGAGTAQSFVAYGPDGALPPALASGNGIRFTVCDARGDTKARSLEIGPGGRIIAGKKVGYDVSGSVALSCS